VLRQLCLMALLQIAFDLPLPPAGAVRGSSLNIGHLLEAGTSTQLTMRKPHPNRIRSVLSAQERGHEIPHVARRRQHPSLIVVRQ